MSRDSCQGTMWVERLAATDEETRQDAAHALDALGPATAPVLVAKHQAGWTFAQFGQDAIPLYVEALRHPSPRVRARAAAKLAVAFNPVRLLEPPCPRARRGVDGHRGRGLAASTAD